MEIMRLEKQLLETDKSDSLEKSTLIQSYKNRISVRFYAFIDYKSILLKLSLTIGFRSGSKRIKEKTRYPTGVTYR